MIKFDTKNFKFLKMDSTDLKTENILERYDLQKSIVNSWDLFKNEVGIINSYLLGQEIKPHGSVNDSIDLLAFDADDSSLVVIELKRDKNKFQLLQSLSYAAMLSTWDKANVLDIVSKNSNQDEREELKSILNDTELSSMIKIILIAESYDPEVIITANWLFGYYGVSIQAFSAQMYKLNQEFFLSFEQRFPLKELEDSYEKRVRNHNENLSKDSVSWEDILPELSYNFAKRAIELCKKIKPGDPSRRRFVGIKTKHDEFEVITLNFRQKYLNVGIKGLFDGAEEKLYNLFNPKIEINKWAGGYTFKVQNEENFNQLIKWLKLE
jgi:hypothetical protein